MEIIKKTSELESYPSAEELPVEDRLLMQKAHETAEQAYAPYSNFKVGCTLRLDDGTLISGNNQENIAYPSGLCAERVAIFAAGATHPGKHITSMAITAHSQSVALDEPVLSCGACLQSISEYERRQGFPIRILLQGERGAIWVAPNGTRTFLPFQFDVEGLKR